MKITWKKQSKGINKKRSLASISNLPFGDDEEQPTTTTTTTTTTTMEVHVEAEGDKTLGSSDGPSPQELADSFRAQGDKLAEVLPMTDFLLFYASNWAL